jgi:hypothetical protein
MAFAGFDRSAYPGDAIMTNLIATNMVFCGYYLFPAPSHTSDGSWMGKRSFLEGLGWGIAPVYVGQQTVGPGNHQASAEQGTTDGNDAADLMTGEGFPAGSYVYLDLENGPPLPPELSDYVGTWCDAIVARGFQPGVYVSHHLAAEVQALRPAARIWAIMVTTVNPHPVAGPPYPDNAPAGSGFAGAFMWQCHQNCQIAVPGGPASLTVDLDTAVSANPSV